MKKVSLTFLKQSSPFYLAMATLTQTREERRHKAIAAVLRNNHGAVVAEQIAPYLDDVGSGFAQEYEDYMLPVLIPILYEAALK